MSILTDSRTGAAPWHLWLVGILSLLWNAVGALDFVMTQTRNEQYMSAFNEEQLAYFYGLPMWVVICWGVAVWGAVLGSILLLLRKRLAVAVFLVSLLGMILTTVHSYLLANGLEVMNDPFAVWFSGAIFVIAVVLFVYAGSLSRRNILR
ncbi:hypothetical protein [Parahaliea aestuarii]|uniref:Sugar transporter n=1 Tax=Parahaliea aestuarii TaxID=1852021 RepID=A0A5C8ZY18_9GAMM|nr:hypothetical protein [Parahaliea aestuarii]TXS93483.1 hypothetical protein FVW59_06535 [Parahaliea aestuarii]